MKLLRRLIVLSLIIATGLPVTAFSRRIQQQQQQNPPQQGGQQTRGQGTRTEGPAQQNPPTGQPTTNQTANPPQQGQTQPGQGGQEGGEGRRPQDPMAAALNGLRVRSIGPALTSGRVVAFAVDPSDRAKYFVGVASGGVWKTVNGGTTFTPVFDNYGSYSIGTIAMDPKNSSVLWVGTGENNSQRSVSYGDGVYKSEDGGRTWRNVGLKKSEHIGRIIIDPKNTDTVYVAAQGPLWSAGGDRGLYKTTDGGKTWKESLKISENTGVTDIIMDPTNPDFLICASYQRRRHVFGFINGGPESVMYKSTDAGATWTKIRSGLPNEDMGRIGLAIAPSDPNIMYAHIEAANQRGGIFRSTDHGTTWERMNPIDNGAMYYAQIFVDPKDPDRIFTMNVNISVSDDGGRTLRALPTRQKHVDNHVIWIDPNNTNFYMVGCDGGVYDSYDRGENWNFKANLPVAQFYDIAVDNSFPYYWVYGGTQDNNSLGGPAKTRAGGIQNSDWWITAGGDGFTSQVDQEDPDTVYAESQFGGLVRNNKKTGERVGIQPQTERGEDPVRWNWDSPLIISPHSHTRLYFASSRLYRSDDRGDSWKPISGDLSRQIDRNTLPIMGKVWGPDAVAKNTSTTLFGDVVAISESPKKEGLLYIGTDDGLIQVSDNGGGKWTKYDKFPDVPDMTHVSRIVASQHNPDTVYAAFENHKNGDFAPYILKSNDRGKTWTSIKANLPANGPVLAIAEDHVNPNLLFVGTEFGLFVSLDGGQKYTQIRGGLPVIAVKDLVIQKRENDLVIATFGRGVYVLDDYTPLRNFKPDMMTKDATIFPIKDALMLPQAAGGGGSLGAGHYVAPNPPAGATITYMLRNVPRTKKQQRLDAERRGTVKFPTVEQLRAEAEEEAPEILMTVTDSSGKAIRVVQVPMAQGINRYTWDMRFPAAVEAGGGGPGGGGGGGRGGGGGGRGGGGGGAGGGGEEEAPAFFQAPGGPLVMPGKYTITLSKRVDGVYTQIAGPETVNIMVPETSTMTAADRTELLDFQQKIQRLQQAMAAANDATNDLKTSITTAKRAIQDTPTAPKQLREDALSIEKRTNQILFDLRGDTVMRGYQENTATSIAERVQNVAAQVRLSSMKPTQTNRDQYAIASQQLSEILPKLKQMVDVDLPKLQKAMDAAGVPWTPGRLPDWKDK